MNIGDITLIHLNGHRFTKAKVVAYMIHAGSDWITFEFIEGPIEGMQLTLTPEQLRTNQGIAA